MNKAFFIDRDGIILEHVYSVDAAIITTALHPNQIAYTKDIFELLRITKEEGFLNIIISNQPNIALKRQSMKEFNRVKDTLDKKFQEEKVSIDDQYYCLHHPFAKSKTYKLDCQCRKPKIGMFLQAAKDYTIDLGQSFYIGDGVTDVIAGHNAGCKTIFIGNNLESGYLKILQEKLSTIEPDFLYKNIREVIKDFQKIIRI